MRLISHRGNLFGSISKLENNPKQIKKVLEMGYDCEIDVWMDYYTKKFYLGHNHYQLKIKESFLFQKGLLIHCKNAITYEYMLNDEIINNSKVEYFFHQKDDVVATSLGNTISYPNRIVINNGILMLPEQGLDGIFNEEAFSKLNGICSDYIGFFKQLMEVNKNGRNKDK